MTQVSESRRQSIADSLVQHGVEPTAEAIANVIKYQEKHKCSVKVACKELAQTKGQTHQQTAATGINAALKDQVGMAQKVGIKMGDRMTQVSAKFATHQFMTNLANGEYASLMEAEFELIESAIDVELTDVSGGILGGNAPLLLESSVEGM